MPNFRLMAGSLPARLATALVSLGVAAAAALWVATYREVRVSNGLNSIMWVRTTPDWSAPVTALIALVGVTLAFLALRRR
jgi:nitric oxide reductase large subunit